MIWVYSITNATWIKSILNEMKYREKEWKNENRKQNQLNQNLIQIDKCECVYVCAHWILRIDKKSSIDLMRNFISIVATNYSVCSTILLFNDPATITIVFNSEQCSLNIVFGYRFMLLENEIKWRLLVVLLDCL